MQSDTAHKVTKAKVIQLDESDWQQKHDQLSKQIREAQLAKARAESRAGPNNAPKQQIPRTPIPRTPAATNLHVTHGKPVGVRESNESRITLKSKSENVTHRSSDKKVTVKSSTGRRKTHSRARESSSLR